MAIKLPAANALLPLPAKGDTPPSGLLHKLQKFEQLAKWAMVAIAMVLAAISAYCAGPLWRDETHTMGLVSQPWSNMMDWTYHDSVPFVPLILFKLGKGIWPGDTLLSVRLTGLFAIWGVILAYARLTRRLAPNAPGFLFFYFVLQPMALRYALNARSYGFSVLFGMLAIGAYWTYYKEGGRKKLIAAFVMGLLFLHSNYLNALYLVIVTALLCIFMVRSGQARRAGLLAAVTVVGLATMAIYIPGLMAARLTAASHFYPLSVGKYFYFLLLVLWAGPQIVWLQCLMGVALVVGTVFGIAAGTRRDAAVFGAALVVMSVAGHAAFMVITGCPVLSWYFVVPGYMILLGLEMALSNAWERLPKPLVWRAARLVLAPCFLLYFLMSGPTQDYLTKRMTNMDVIASVIARDAKPGDYVVVVPFFYGNSFNYYYRGTVPWDTIPALSDYTLQRDDLAIPIVLATKRIGDLTPALQKVKSTLESGHRVWVVGQPLDPTPELDNVVLPDNMPMLERYHKVLDNYPHQLGAIILDAGGHVAKVPVLVELPLKPLETPPLYIVEK